MCAGLCAPNKSTSPHPPYFQNKQQTCPLFSSFPGMKNLCRESLTKACVLTVLLAAGVCAVMLLPTSDELVERPGRQLYIPRYLFEKEIRGPTYHVVHRVLENDGYRSPVRTGVSQGQKTPHGKFLIRRRRALQGA